MTEPKTTRENWFEQRDDLTGEHPFGDAGQIIFALLFLMSATHGGEECKSPSTKIYSSL
jgi:hypothetical protein